MSDESDRDGFLSRWARRKASAKDVLQYLQEKLAWEEVRCAASRPR